MEKKYTIINKDLIDSIDFNSVLQTSKETLRYNLDKTKAIIKFRGSTPSLLESMTLYTQEQILEIINNSENGWIENVE